MFDWLIPLLIVIVLILYVLEFLGVIDIVWVSVGLVVGAIGLTAKLLIRLLRHLSGSNAPKSQA